MQVQFHIREFDYTIQKFSSQSRFVTLPTNQSSKHNTEISQAITMQLITGVIEQFQSQLKRYLRMEAWCGIELKSLVTVLEHAFVKLQKAIATNLITEIINHNLKVMNQSVNWIILISTTVNRNSIEFW